MKMTDNSLINMFWKFVKSILLNLWFYLKNTYWVKLYKTLYNILKRAFIIIFMIYKDQTIDNIVR